MTAKDRLEAAADRLELVELLHRYAWAIDSGDWDLLAQVFTDDAERLRFLRTLYLLVQTDLVKV